jgi:membrane-associated phospholipid phosphatase
MSAKNRAFVAVILLLIVAACAPVAANTFARQVGDATGPLVAVSLAATYLGGGDQDKSDAVRAADAAIIAVATAELLKPNLTVNSHEYEHSFPSGHAAIAFATASALAQAKPKHKWLYYAGAALVGWSRVESRAHTWGDVAAGAALGIGVGKLSMQSSDGLLIGRVYRF